MSWDRLDFRGDAALSVNDREGTLGNSNERASKGFVTTFALPRTLGDSGQIPPRLDICKGISERRP